MLTVVRRTAIGLNDSVRLAIARQIYPVDSLNPSCGTTEIAPARPGLALFDDRESGSCRWGIVHDEEKGAQRGSVFIDCHPQSEWAYSVPLKQRFLERCHPWPEP